MTGVSSTAVDDQQRKAIEDELLRIEEGATYSSQSQFEQAKLWRGTNLVLGVPAAALAGVAGATALASTTGRVTAWHPGAARRRVRRRDDDVERCAARRPGARIEQRRRDRVAQGVRGVRGPRRISRGPLRRRRLAAPPALRHSAHCVRRSEADLDPEARRELSRVPRRRFRLVSYFIKELVPDPIFRSAVSLTPAVSHVTASARLPHAA